MNAEAAPRLRLAARATTRAAKAALLTAETFGRVRLEIDADARPRDGLSERRRMRKSAALLRSCAVAALDLHGINLHVEGALPDDGAVVVANHRSWLDPLVLLALVAAAPLAKAEVARWPFVGPLATALGALFVERGDAMSGARVLRRARRSLAAGVSVVGFPEGTTTRGPPLEFRRGLFGLARIARVPIVPVAIYSDDRLAWVGDDALAPHWLSLCERTDHDVLVRFGAARAVDDDDVAAADVAADDAAAREARAFITASYEEMRCRNTT